MLFGRDADIQGCQYGWTCTCKGFDIRRTCSHVTTVAASGARCAWNGRWDGTDPEEPEAGSDHCCPECSGPVFSFAYGA